MRQREEIKCWIGFLEKLNLRDKLRDRRQEGKPGCLAGVGGNLVAIQTSRISTHLHLWGTPGVLPLWMKKCWPSPCSTFCSSGASGAFQGPRGHLFQGWHHWSLCHQARPPAQGRPLRPRHAVQAPRWAVCPALSDRPPVRRRAPNASAGTSTPRGGGCPWGVTP